MELLAENRAVLLGIVFGVLGLLLVGLVWDYRNRYKQFCASVRWYLGPAELVAFNPNRVKQLWHKKGMTPDHAAMILAGEAQRRRSTDKKP